MTATKPPLTPEEATRVRDSLRASAKAASAAIGSLQRLTSVFDGLWTIPTPTDTPLQAKKRATARLLLQRANHARADPIEARSCREKAQALRERHHLDTPGVHP